MHVVRHPAEKDGIGRVGPFLESVSTASDHSPSRDRWACRAGCGWCCRIPVGVTPPEALHLAGWLRRQAPRDLRPLRRRLRLRRDELEGLGTDAHANSGLPCVLLDERESCLARPARPSACRAWASFSQEACRRACRSGRPTRNVPTDPAPRLATRELARDWLAALARRGLEVKRLELASALERALSPNAARDWLAGRPVFASCRPEVVSGEPRST